MQVIYSSPIYTTVFIVALTELFKFIFGYLGDCIKEERKLAKLDNSLDKLHKIIQEAVKNPEKVKMSIVEEKKENAKKTNKSTSQNAPKSPQKKPVVKKEPQKSK